MLTVNGSMEVIEGAISPSTQEPPVPVNPLEPTIIGENKMADVDTITLSQEHSDLRREAVEHTNEIVREGLKGDYATQKTINDMERAQSNQIDMMEDVVNAQFSTVARDTADLRAQVTSLGQFVRDSAQMTALQTEKSVLQSTIEGQKNTQYLSDKITNDGEKTRALINEMKYGDLNRALIERNAELVEERHYGRHWRGNWDQSQFASLQSQLQAFQSQLASSTQGMVNFGTQAGVGQTSTSNNVR